jgi:hypothetical protein
MTVCIEAGKATTSNLPAFDVINGSDVLSRSLGKFIGPDDKYKYFSVVRSDPATSGGAVETRPSMYSELSKRSIGIR